MQWGFRGYSGGYRYTMGFSGPTSSLCSSLLKKKKKLPLPSPLPSYARAGPRLAFLSSVHSYGPRESTVNCLSYAGQGVGAGAILKTRCWCRGRLEGEDSQCSPQWASATAGMACPPALSWGSPTGPLLRVILEVLTPLPKNCWKASAGLGGVLTPKGAS